MKVFSRLILLLCVLFISVKAYSDHEKSSEELISAAKESAMGALNSLDAINTDALNSDDQMSYDQAKEKIHNSIFKLDQIPQRFVKTYRIDHTKCDAGKMQLAKDWAQEYALADCELIYDSCKIVSSRIIDQSDMKDWRTPAYCIAQVIAVPAR